MNAAMSAPPLKHAGNVLHPGMIRFGEAVASDYNGYVLIASLYKAVTFSLLVERRAAQ